jgi:hypothetical protein
MGSDGPNRMPPDIWCMHVDEIHPELLKWITYVGMKTYDSITLHITYPENNTPRCFSLFGAKRNSPQKEQGKKEKRNNYGSSLLHCKATVTGWYRTKRPMHCDHFQIYCEFPIWHLIIPYSSTTAHWQ